MKKVAWAGGSINNYQKELKVASITTLSLKKHDNAWPANRDSEGKIVSTG